MEQRAEKLTAWVAEKYAGVLIPLSGEPYISHCLAVAEMAAPYVRFGYEAGLCHDMLEDHITTSDKLHHSLLDCGYHTNETEKIIAIVTELSDVYTLENYPGQSKKSLRRLENQRLATVSADAQTIKYADLIYNAGWVRQYEPQKWPRYVRRKRKLLQMLDKGNLELRIRALQI